MFVKVALDDIFGYVKHFDMQIGKMQRALVTEMLRSMPCSAYICAKALCPNIQDETTYV